MLGRQIFRKKALAKLSSPEQLDQLITVTDPRGWIALIAIGLIIVTAITWSIVGEIPVTVNGNGILLRDGGRHEIISHGSGIVVALNVHLDDFVKKGDVIAVVSQPEMNFELEKLEKELKSLKTDENKDTKMLQNIKYLEFEIEELKERIDLFSRVKSPEDGHIVSLMIDLHDYVPGDTVIAIIENSASELGSILYIPVATGKNVHPGMKVQISPSTVKSEEFGFMMGEIKFVSEFPSTEERMMTVLENKQLVDAFSEVGPPLEIHVSLDRDSSTSSGFKWSSGEGPQSKLTSGTLCGGTVVLTRFHPISLIFPEAR